MAMYEECDMDLALEILSHKDLEDVLIDADLTEEHVLAILLNLGGVS